MKRKGPLISAAILIVAALWWMVTVPASVARTCRDCAIILVSIDTLRSDRLGSYGSALELTPNIDRFSRDSAVFRTAIAQAPSTAASHGSIFTSLIPSAHGGSVSKKAPLSQAHPVMAEILSEHGFRTASYNGGGQISSTFGFNRGFEIYESYSEGDYEKEYLADRSKPALKWLEAMTGRPSFLFLHSYEVHHPYAPAEEFCDDAIRSYAGPLPRSVDAKILRAINKTRMPATDGDRAYVEALYNAEVRSVDKAFGEFIDALKGMGRYENSLIILTSDHGEEFGEHKAIGWHSHTLYDELLKVPLIIKFPEGQFAGKVVTQQVRSIDILPTVLEHFHIPSNKHFQGVSVLGLLRGESLSEGFAVSQKDVDRPTLPAAIRNSDWKLNMGRLYDMVNDPGERRNLAKQRPEIFNAFKAMLDSIVSSSASDGNEEVQIDEGAVEQLRTLGYLD
ncbi:MAG: sulfatase [Deltaproteobacteria bacterium]|nr:sulfatase [Deltaproteobacteria bacterium]